VKIESSCSVEYRKGMTIKLAVDEQTVVEVVFGETKKNCIKQLRYCKPFVSDEHREATDAASDERSRIAAGRP
jgi:hypothetical protein